MTKIENAIKESGIRKNFIAGKCGVAPITVTQWCKGRTKIKGEHLLILASILNVEPKELMGDINKLQQNFT